MRDLNWCSLLRCLPALALAAVAAACEGDPEPPVRETTLGALLSSASFGDPALGVASPALIEVFDGRVVVADPMLARVLVFDSTLVLERSWGEPGGGPGELQGIQGLAADAQGVWVGSRGRLQRFTWDGVYRESRPIRSPTAVVVVEAEPWSPTADGELSLVPYDSARHPWPIVGEVQEHFGGLNLPQRVMRTGLAVRPDGFILADLQEALVWSLEPSDQGQLVAHQATLPRLFLEEVEALKERLAADASAGLGVRVLRSVRSTSDGGVWLPILSPKVLGLVSPNDSAEVSVLIRTTDREEHRGAVDAVLDANRLYILYLDRIDVFRIPDMDATNPEPRSTP